MTGWPVNMDDWILIIQYPVTSFDSRFITAILVWWTDPRSEMKSQVLPNHRQVWTLLNQSWKTCLENAFKLILPKFT